MASTITCLAVAVGVGAAGVAAYPLYTDWRAMQHQKALEAEFADQTGAPDEGQPYTRLIIPRLHLNTIVVEGTSGRALAAGAGHYRTTPAPGSPGNVAIAGHRTMNGKPFANLDLLRPGDQIELVTQAARYFYVMVPGFGGHDNPWVVDPTDFSVVAQTKDSILTLTTCHPRGTARQRLVARARLVKTQSVA